MKSTQPIGVFDSGVGGLTVLKALRSLMPSEDLVYVGDTARVPYGTKSPATILRYALENSLYLLDRGVKILVIACNTASAVALQYLSDRLKVPVIGVIEPGARAALAASLSKHVGIIGTEGTIRSGAYQKILHSCDAAVKSQAIAAPLFVPLVEEGIEDEKILTPIFDLYLKNLQNVDTLILGCTHYPLLSSALQKYLGQKVKLIDSAEATAISVKACLNDMKLMNSQNSTGEVKLCVTDAPERVESIVQRIFGEKISPVEKISL